MLSLLFSNWSSIPKANTIAHALLVSSLFITLLFSLQSHHDMTKLSAHGHGWWHFFYLQSTVIGFILNHSKTSVIYIFPLQIVPKRFSSKWLPGRKTKILLVDMCGRKWPVVFNPCGATARFQMGWFDFAQQQSLKEGDICVLELKNPNNINVFVRILRLEDYVASVKGWRQSIMEGVVSNSLPTRGQGKASQEDDVMVLEQTPPRTKRPAAKLPEFDPGCTSDDSCDKNEMIRAARLTAPTKTREVNCSKEEKLASPLLDALTESTMIAGYIASLRNTGIAESKEKMLSVQRGGKDSSNKDSDTQKTGGVLVPSLLMIV